MRSRLAPWLAVLTLTAAGAAAAAGYGLTAPERYRATAQILVAPVSPSDPTFAGIGVLRDTGGKRTAAASVAVLLRAPQIVDAAAAQLGLKRSRQSLLDALDAHVVDRSDVVAVTAEDTSANGAAQLANTFANALIAQRSATFQSELAAAIRRDQQLLASTPASSSDAARAISSRLTTLRGLEGRPDPTIRLAAQATAPSSSSWPNVPLLIGIGAGIGAGAGILVALLTLGVRRARARPAGEPGRHGPLLSDRELEELGDRLEARLVRREAGLAARERDLQAKLDELRAAQEASLVAARDASELARREEQLSKRIDAAAKREAELARRAAEVALRERESAAEQAEAAAAAAAAAEAAAEAPAPAPVPPPGADGPRGSYNLMALEQLVDDRGSAFPERLEEWSSYLYLLREYAAPDGAVPASFDWLIHDTFEELLT